MNIVMPGHKRIPSCEGGIEIVVEELSTRMVQKGHYVTCLNRAGHHVSGAEFDSKIGAEYKGVKLENVGGKVCLNPDGGAVIIGTLNCSEMAA